MKIFSFRIPPDWPTQVSAVIVVSMAEEDVVNLDAELLAELEENAATRYTEDDTHFVEVSCPCHVCCRKLMNYLTLLQHTSPTQI